MSERLIPARAVPPGRIVSRELAAHGWTQKDLAQIMGRPEQAISEIVRGKKRITPETALELADAFGGSPQFWVNLEANYRLVLSQKEKRGKGIARRSALYRLVPVRELLKRGWIRATGSLDELEEEICSLLGIPSPDEEPRLEASFRHSKDREPDRNNLICWVNRVKHLARKQDDMRFERTKLERAVQRILNHAQRAEDVQNVPGLLRSLGIHFVIVPHLPKTYLDGAAFHIRGKPVVAMTLRHDRVDSFWFTLMHELAHVIAGHKGMYLDDLDERSDDHKERQANRIASDWLIEPRAYMSFVKETAPYFSRQKITVFAQSQKRHPGIVLGRLQNENRVGYEHLRQLLEKVRPYLAASIDRPN